MWILMKSEGTAQDEDATHVLDKCLQHREVTVLELITPEVSRTATHEKSQLNQLFWGEE